MATAVKPERILKDLAKLWNDLSKQDNQKGSSGVLRACAMTLIAAVEQESDAQAVSETIAEIMHQHPSRVIVIRIDPAAEAGLDARVFAQCWMPFGRRQQICCEEIEITASDDRIEDLPKLMLGLIVPDLPVVLWCRSERLFRDISFQYLFPLANKIIIDSSSFGDSSQAPALIRLLTERGFLIADLAWTRLTRVRQTIAQIFENQNLLSKLSQIERVVISYAAPDATKPPAALQYLVGWFRATVAAKVETVFRHPQSAEEVLGIAIEGHDLHVSIEIGPGAAAVQVDGLNRRISYPKLSGADLMRDELSILTVDPTFRKCLG